MADYAIAAPGTWPPAAGTPPLCGPTGGQPLYAGEGEAAGVPLGEDGLAEPDALGACEPLLAGLACNQPTAGQVSALGDILANHIDTVWVMIVLVLIFNMQLGFILLEAGAVRKKNIMNILFKNLVDMFISTLAFWFIGFKWSVSAHGGVIGAGSNFTLGFEKDDFVTWLTGLFFCNTASTIVSGSLAERVLLDTYVFFTMTMCTVIYPVMASWVWGDGWLS